MTNVLVEYTEHAAWVTLNRPEAMNALSKKTNEDLLEVCEEIRQKKSLRAAVITGTGERAFCAGADLKERKGVSAEETGAYVDAISGAINAWANLPQATIGLINGFAFGGGMELALACDFRVASENAQFGLTEVRLGIMPGAGGTQRLPRLLGVAKAKEMILLGERVDASQALHLGLVRQVVPIGDLLSAGEKLVSTLGKCAPLSIAKAKEAIDTGSDLPLNEGLEVERQCYDVTLFTEDRNEGLRAFAEKRPPQYTGK